jgi:ribonuclease HI
MASNNLIIYREKKHDKPSEPVAHTFRGPVCKLKMDHFLVKKGTTTPLITLPPSMTPSPPSPSPPLPMSSHPFRVPLLRMNSVHERQSVFCDGSTFRNGHKNACGGIGIYFGPDDPRNVSEPFTLGIPTNQRTEIYAMVVMFKILDRMICETPTTHYDFDIYTDSEYVINCLTKWIGGWIAKDWIKADGKPVKNVELLKALLHLYNTHKHQYHIHHVRSHQGETTPEQIGNKYADQLAVAGSKRHPNYHT